MCGITGFISRNFNKNDLVQMTNALSHRGPDASGYFFDQDKGIAIGHRRLSILDLSDAANQPMTSHCGRYKIVFNGEVYNFRDIANSLKNTNWKTNSDTEVILEAYAKWGISFVQELNGMYAIAIYDKFKNKLVIFRDRMGIKPIYYFFDKNDFIFASEVKSICTVKKQNKLNHKSIYSYLHLGYIPNNDTIYEKILKIPPGSYLEYSNQKINIKAYWKIENKVKRNTNYNIKSAKNNLNKLIQNSVEKRLISDVPIGTFLSGGVDSSLITAVAQRINESPINTFSIGFEHSKHNESKHSRIVAKHLGTNHHEFILKEKDALNLLEKIMENFDEPFSDSSALPTLLVSKMAKKYVTVCLSGDGGDELFMGYGAYNWTARLSNPLIWYLRKPASKFLAYSNYDHLKRGGLVLNSPKKNWKSHIFSQEQYLFSENEIESILIKKDNSTIEKLNIPIQTNRKINTIEEQSIFDLKNYLVDDLLIKVDKSSMYTSLEARVPLLDHKIVEFSLNLNHKLKVKGNVSKYVLKQVLYDYIPKKIMERPKWGFTFPVSKWLKTDLYFLIENFLNDEILVELNIYNVDVVKSYVNRYLKGEDYLWNRIWSLIILNKFLIKYHEELS